MGNAMSCVLIPVVRLDRGMRFHMFMIGTFIHLCSQQWNRKPADVSPNLHTLNYTHPDVKTDQKAIQMFYICKIVNLWNEQKEKAEYRNVQSFEKKKTVVSICNVCWRLEWESTCSFYASTSISKYLIINTRIQDKDKGSGSGTMHMKHTHARYQITDIDKTVSKMQNTIKVLVVLSCSYVFPWECLVDWLAARGTSVPCHITPWNDGYRVSLDSIRKGAN